MTLFAVISAFFSALSPTTVYGASTQQAPPPSMATPVMPPQLRDIKDVIALPVSIPWWCWLAGGLALLAIIGLILFILKKNSPKKQKQIPPHERALHALKSARDLMTPDQSRAFAIKMAEILRRYIEERFHLFRPNLTTREFLQALTRQTDMKNSALLAYDNLLKDWLNHCDMVKFARYRLPEEEMEQMLVQVRGFIQTTAEADTPNNGRRKQ